MRKSIFMHVAKLMWAILGKITGIDEGLGLGIIISKFDFFVVWSGNYIISIVNIDRCSQDLCCPILSFYTAKCLFTFISYLKTRSFDEKWFCSLSKVQLFGGFRIKPRALYTQGSTLYIPASGQLLPQQLSLISETRCTLAHVIHFGHPE